MDFTSIDAYLKKLHFAQVYLEVPEDEREKVVFEATELLKDNFIEPKITERVVALQVLFMLEGESEDFSKYKRHGVKSFSTKGVSVSFDGSNISPDVLSLLGENKASVGRLI